MRRWLALFFLLLPVTAWGDANIGDKPVLQTKAVEGTEVSLDQYKGKFVVVDFFTLTADGRTVAHKVLAVHSQHASDNVQFIFIFATATQSRVKQFVSTNKIDWPCIWNGPFGPGAISQAWGVTRMTDFILDGDGKVVWKGTADELENALSDVLAGKKPTITVPATSPTAPPTTESETEPTTEPTTMPATTEPQQVDPQVVDDALDNLDAVEKSLDAKDSISALNHFAAIPADASDDEEVFTRVQEIQPRVQYAAKELLASVDALIQQKQYMVATDRLNQLLASLKNAPIAKDLQQRLDDLNANPAVKKQFVDAKRENDANSALAEARDLIAKKRSEQAYFKLKALVQTYPHTVAADAAAKIIHDDEQNAALMNRIQQQADDAKAKPLLSLARSLADSRQFDEARKKYQQIIDRCPHSSYVAVAKEEMQALANK